MGCLTIEWETRVTLSSRTSERSERDPGPITTDVHVAPRWSRNSIRHRHRWLWVPAFAGTT
jgi:hypothetical protein